MARGDEGSARQRAWQRIWDGKGAGPPAAGPDGAWFRLAPAWGPASAVLAKRSPPLSRCPRCGFAERVAPELVVDRKLVPEIDLMDEGYGTALLCSERFVEALEAAGATGWSARLLPHATPNRVHGRRLYWLTAVGEVGPLTDDTAVYRGERDETCPVCGRPLVFDPVPPVAFDATGAPGAGHDVAWSTQWFGGARSAWRALIVSRRVVDALAARLPRPWTFGVDAVRLDGAVPSRAGEAGARAGADEPPPPPPPLEQTLARVADEAARYGHELMPPADPDTVADAVTELGKGPLPDLQRLYQRSDGLSLFGNVLSVLGVGAEQGLVQLNERAPEWDYPVRDDWAYFAWWPYEEFMWALDADGRVRATRPDGGVYGPAAPFDAWLADQVADLAYAADHREELSWAEEVLRAPAPADAEEDE